MYFIGIDIGTSSICGVVYHTSTQNVISITKENCATIPSSKSWEKKQDADTIIDIVINMVREFQSQYKDIKGIGITGQMHGIVYTDIQGNAVSPLYTWQDGRGNLNYRENQSYAAYLSDITGCPVATGYGLVTHFYNVQNRLVPTNATKLCTIMDYAVMKLSGKKIPQIDPTNAASLGFFDKKELVFDMEAIQKAGIDITMVPEVAPSASLAGYYHKIPVYTAIGDNQASFLGSVRDIEHSIHITVGTSSQMSIYADHYMEIDSLDTRPLPGGGYLLVGAALCGGYSFALLRKFFNNTLSLFTGKELSQNDLYTIMTSISYQKDSKNDLVIDTLFDGTRSNPYERGKITNISTSNFTPENLIIGFVKGISQGLYNYFQLLPESLKKNKTILVGSGNGIKKNSLLYEALEDRFNRPMQLSTIQEEAAFGACLCSMREGHYSR